MPLKRPPWRGRQRSFGSLQALSETALKDVRRAHSLIERGDHENAAHLFERQARDAADHGIYLPAAHLYLQAGRAWLLAGGINISEPLFRQGLRILAEQTNPKRLKLSGDQLIADLFNLGQNHLAADLRGWLEQVPEIQPTTLVSAVDDPQPRSRLRSQCPYCKAILRPADIEPRKVDRDACVYCGNLIGDNKKV